MRTRVCVGGAAAAMVLGGTLGAQEALLQGAGASVKHKAAKTAAKTKHKHKKKKKPITKAVMPAAAPCTAVPATESALGAVLTSFLQHVDAAHLQTSPQDQATALLADSNNYVLLHTILVENMLAPTETAVGQLGDVVTGLIAPLVQHVDSAHLSTSPQDQVESILSDPGNYVLLHTILVNNMIGPLESLLSRVASGTPGSICAPVAPAATGPAATTPATKTITMSNFKFDMPTITVPVGTTVTWKNSDSAAHTVTSMGSGPLNSPNIAGGGTFSYTFTAPGSYMYVCSIHPNMMATVIVQ
jgi:plastocyanin